MPWPFSRCVHLISYDNTNLSFQGLDGQAVFSLKIAQIGIKKELLQPAAEIAQLYDMFQFSNCNKIQQLRDNSSEKTRFIWEAHKNEERLIQFMTLVKLAADHSSPILERSLADWIASAFTGLQQGSPLIPSSIAVRGAKGEREPVPINELNRVKRSVARAKYKSNYLRDALKQPEFDIEKAF